MVIDSPERAVVPTHVGVDRACTLVSVMSTGCPHARGGGPSPIAETSRPGRLSPRTWGWTVSRDVALLVDVVVPTHVGVDLMRSPRSAGETSCPHARGGGPSTPGARPRGYWLSPRTWGWTRERHADRHHAVVVPTHVGVDLSTSECPRRSSRCPHARGGGPLSVQVTGALRELSPRTWGWTLGTALGRRADDVVPTHVGVDPSCPGDAVASGRCPHARGGGPRHHAIPDTLEQLSPRTWGWTPNDVTIVLCHRVVPTHVGVDLVRNGRDTGLTGCPHARGGGPEIANHRIDVSLVVPTHVGVDLYMRPLASECDRCPHARGGGPIADGADDPPRQLSPRTWGWTATPAPASGS